MQLIFGPRVDIQHFNVSFNNWPPQYYALTTMQLIFGPKDIQHFSVSLANNWPPNTMHLTMQLIFGPKSGYSTF
jgi:hypothetical protein